jgi:hypothetical protein
VTAEELDATRGFEPGRPALDLATKASYGGRQAVQGVVRLQKLNTMIS